MRTRLQRPLLQLTAIATPILKEMTNLLVSKELLLLLLKAWSFWNHTLVSFRSNGIKVQNPQFWCLLVFRTFDWHGTGIQRLFNLCVCNPELIGLFWNLLEPGHSQSSACFCQLQKHSWTLCPARQVSVSCRLSLLDFCQEPVSPNVWPLTCTLSARPGNNLLLVDHTDDGLKLASWLIQSTL